MFEGFEEHDAEIVDVVFSGFDAGFAFGCLADAVSAQFDHFADGVDVGRLDVFVDESIGMEDVDCGGEAGGELKSIGHGEALVGNYLCEVGVDWLHDGVDDGGVIERELAELFEAEDVGMAEGFDAAPASEDFFLVEVAGDEPDDGGLSVGVEGGEEGAAAFGKEEFFQREGAVNGAAFVFGPKFHRGLPVLGGLDKAEGRWANRTETIVPKALGGTRAWSDHISLSSIAGEGVSGFYFW